MKIVLLTDTHWGARQDSLFYISYMEAYYKEQFFPYLKKHNIDTIIHLGDLVERRKFTNHYCLNILRKSFIEPLCENNITMHMILGNHDVYYRDTNDVSAVKEFLNQYSNIPIYDSTTEIEIDSIPFLMVPWINSSNKVESLEKIKKTKAQIVFGHLELNGFLLQKGRLCDEGFDPKIFQKFDMVYSGHFHHKQQSQNIMYLGSPYQLDWNDYDDPRGFHIFDTITKEIEFIKNPHDIYQKIIYDDTDNDIDILHNLEKYKDKIVKVYTKSKTKPELFDAFIDQLELVGTADLTVIPDEIIKEFFIEGVSEDIDSIDDTVTFIKKSVNEYTTSKEDRKTILNELSLLYEESLNLEK